MFFSVISRDGATGRKTESVIEALDREALWKILKERGVRVVSVSETTGPRPSARQSAARPKAVWRGLLAGCVVVLAAVAAFLFLREGATEKPSAAPAAKRLIAEKKPSLPSTNAVPEAVAPVEGKGGKSNIVWVSETSYILTCKDGSKCQVYVKDPSQRGPAPVFKSRLNNFLTNYLVPGEWIPPTPIEFSDNDIMAALMEKIEFKDEDDDETRFKKESVSVLREELKKAIKEGKSPREFLDDLQDRQRLEANYVSSARDMIFESIANDSVGEAKATYEKLNKYLKEKGLPGVRLPRRLKRKLEEAQ